MHVFVYLKWHTRPFSHLRFNLKLLARPNLLYDLVGYSQPESDAMLPVSVRVVSELSELVDCQIRGQAAKYMTFNSDSIIRDCYLDLVLADQFDPDLNHPELWELKWIRDDIAHDLHEPFLIIYGSVKAFIDWKLKRDLFKLGLHAKGLKNVILKLRKWKLLDIQINLVKLLYVCVVCDVIDEKIQQWNIFLDYSAMQCQLFGIPGLGGQVNLLLYGIERRSEVMAECAEYALNHILIVPLYWVSDINKHAHHWTLLIPHAIFNGYFEILNYFIWILAIWLRLNR